MDKLNELYCRSYQFIFRVVARFLNWQKPYLVAGDGSLKKLPELIKAIKVKKVLIVTDANMVKIGLLDGCFSYLKNEGIPYVLYDKTIPNPTVENVEDALNAYKENECGAIVAFGGGSSMDCGKGVAARVARPEKTIPQLRGLFKIRKTIPPIFAIPTTAGTGSEVTVAAVISDHKTHEKYSITDTSLIPRYAILDPTLTIGLPKSVTADSGIDALSHAVEAYIGESNTDETRKNARLATKMIFENLPTAFADGKNIKARENMLKASFHAGLAFTRAYVGYVHAISHAITALYGTAHGFANAVIMPYILESYGQSAQKPLAELWDLVHYNGSSDLSEAEKAMKFIGEIRDLSISFGIPEHLTNIEESDIETIAEKAAHEGNPLYPVPKIFSKEQLAEIVKQIKG
jgi:alcohol dehydrogenase class IV